MPRAEKQWTVREAEAVELTRMLMHGFYEKTLHPKDMVPYLSKEHFSWIGAADGEVYTSIEEGVTAFSYQRDTNEVPLFHVTNDVYRPTTITSSVYLVLATVSLQVDPESRLVISENQRGTFLYHIEGGKLRLVHLHVSNPWTIMAKEKHFPVHTGRTNYEYMQQIIAAKNLERMPELTDRQKVVLEMLTQGRTYKEISETLNITLHTVRYHVSELVRKFHVKNRIELISTVERQRIAAGGGRRPGQTVGKIKERHS